MASMAKQPEMTGPKKGDSILLADLMNECRSKRKTGVLFVGVKQDPEYLIGFYFLTGEIRCATYRLFWGAECLKIIQYCDFANAVYLDGVKAPVVNRDLPETGEIISFMRSTGKTISMGMPLSSSNRSCSHVSQEQ